ncbi:MAG: T9SS type A sorting domain-containing protein [Rhizobacter sp.]|nr:T9SS type A sorting domain-containing protein [Ferruginibacter sp.]
MKKQLLIFSLVCLAVQTKAADYYWVAGAGNWSDINHWATTSGGSVKHSIVPSITDDVYFDANSGLLSNADVTLPISGPAYCRNMSWAGVTAAANFRNFGGFILYVHGNLELSATVRYGWQGLQFAGNSNATFITNGAARFPASGWYNSFEVNKPGGSLKVTDQLFSQLVVNTLQLTAGQLDLSNGSHYVNDIFTLSNNNVKSLDITNATLQAGEMNFVGSNTTLAAFGSNLIAMGNFNSSGLSFPTVSTGAGGNSMQINNTVFGDLTFTNPNSLPGQVRIGAGNIIRKLEFKSAGYLRFAGNVIDSLIMAPSKRHIFVGNNTIKKYLKLNSNDCTGLGEISSDATGATLSFDAGAVLDLNNIYISNMTATGGITLPVTLQGADGGNNVGWNFTNPVSGNSLYWVGGAGDWNDASHWSNASGGPGGFCIPFTGDDVVFDAASGFGPGNNIVTSNARAWCKNISWAAVTGNPIFNENSSFDMEVWGSVSLSAGATINAEFILRGPSAASLNSNGNTLGLFRVNIAKTGISGGLTLVDDHINQNTVIRLSSGQFLLPGRTLHISQFFSNSGTRTIDISNANITTENFWTLTGAGRTWINNASGSFILSKGGMDVFGLAYPNVELNSATGPFSIAGATFGKLVFSNLSPSSTAKVGNNNSADTLDFKGAGQLGSGNSIGQLFFAPSRNYLATGINSITGKLTFNSAACTGLGELRGLGGSVATIQFNGVATASMNNVYLENIAATGNGIPITLTGADAGGNTGFIINVAAGTPRYWVGGSGDWNDATHWSLTSGGVGGACIPTVNDDVFFNAASFSAGSSTITTSVGNAYCRNMNWQGAGNAPVFNESGAFNMEVWGNLVMNPAVTMNASLIFTGPVNASIQVNGSSIGDFDFTMAKTTGIASVTLADNLVNPNTKITASRGTLNLAGRTISVEAVSDESTSLPTTMNISNATITGAWGYTGTNKNLVANNSFLTVYYIIVNGGVYNNINVTATTGSSINLNNSSYGSLLFSNGSAISGARIGGGNTIRKLEFKGRGAITGSLNTIDSLIFSPGKIYTLTAGTNTTVTKEWFGSGTPCNLTEIVSSSTTSNATITKTTGSVDLDYARIRRLTAAGAASPFVAREHSIDQGNNISWNIAPYNGAAPIAGLGPNLSLNASDFPYVLHTYGFFASPLSIYTWGNNSSADSLVITGPGTYTITVSFSDGCSVRDTIVVAQNIVLPIHIASFKARANQCTVTTEWEVSNAINFASFNLERSNDGVNYSPIADIAYNPGQSNYSFADVISEPGVFYYRIKLIDSDDVFEYSKIVNVKAECNNSDIRVFPTISSKYVDIFLPAPYWQAKINLYNSSGQRLNLRAEGTGGRRYLDISTQPKGYYFLGIVSEKGTYTVKIVKQ